MESQKFKKLLEEGKVEEAKLVLQVFIAKQISPREQGEALLAMASMYMEIENTVNREYLQILDQAIAELGRLKKRNDRISDAVNLKMARKTISGA